MFRKIVKIEKAEDLTVHLPEEYLNKEVEVSAVEVEEKETDERTRKRKSASDAIAFFKTIQTDLSHFKFNREEANAR